MRGMEFKKCLLPTFIRSLYNNARQTHFIPVLGQGQILPTKLHQRKLQTPKGKPRILPLLGRHGGLSNPEKRRTSDQSRKVYQRLTLIHHQIYVCIYIYNSILTDFNLEHLRTNFGKPFFLFDPVNLKAVRVWF